MTTAAPTTAVPSRALTIITAATLVRLVFAAVVPAFPDETYYWDWSRRLAAGYFDHPPAIAWLIRAGSSVLAPFGAAATPLGVRLGAVTAGRIAVLATAGAARRLGGEAGAVRAAIVMTVLPLATAGLMLATPDAPLLAAIAVSLYCVIRVLETRVGSYESLRWWVITGIAVGVAFWSKYTSVFVPIAVAAAVFARAGLRVRLREPGPYVACVVAAMVFLPVLVWNARHDWISFTYQLSHGLEAGSAGRSALAAAWRNEGSFFGGQAALASPILFIMLGLAVARSLGRGAPGVRFVLATVSLVSFAVFVFSATRRRVEPNWPGPAYIPAVILLVTMRWSPAIRRWFTRGVVLAGAMSLLIYAQVAAPILPIAPTKDPVARANGWNEAGRRAGDFAKAVSIETRTTSWLAGDRYQEASELAFHASGNPTTFSTNIAGRPNHYDLWPRFFEVARRGDNLIMLVDDGASDGSVRALSPWFSEVRQGRLIELRRGAAVIGTRRLWALVGWKGGWPSSVTP